MLVVGGLQFYDQLGIAFVSNVRTEHDLLRMRKLSSFPQLLMFLLCHDNWPPIEQLYLDLATSSFRPIQHGSRPVLTKILFTIEEEVTFLSAIY